MPPDSVTKRYKQRKDVNMTIDTPHAEIASQMLTAHRELGSWVKVAKRLGDNPKTGRPYSGTMLWWWGTGRREIPDAVAKAWKHTGPRKRVPRVSIECSPEIRDSLRLRIKQPGDTWNDALSRILSDTQLGSAPHLFGMLDSGVLQLLTSELQAEVYKPQDANCHYHTDVDIVTIQWWLDRLELELSIRRTPDWARSE